MKTIRIEEGKIGMYVDGKFQVTETYPKYVVFEADKCTIYRRAAMSGVPFREEVLKAVGYRERDAQWDMALRISFNVRGKRKGSSIRDHGLGDVVVLDGWGHPDPPQGPYQSNGYRDARVTEDFDVFIDGLVRGGASIVGDFRGMDPKDRYGHQDLLSEGRQRRPEETNV